MVTARMGEWKSLLIKTETKNQEMKVQMTNKDFHSHSVTSDIDSSWDNGRSSELSYPRDRK